MSIVTGARNLDAAKIFLDWALTVDAQTIRDRTKATALPSDRTAYAPDKVKALEQAKLTNYDFAKYGASSERKRLIDKWDREVKKRAALISANPSKRLARFSLSLPPSVQPPRHFPFRLGVSNFHCYTKGLP